MKTTVNIKREFPPNFKQIEAMFDLSKKNIVFTYGDTIYNPYGGVIPPHLVVHEHTHTIQQGDNPDGWWKKYLTDDKFRCSQEVEAYQNQI